MRFRTAFLISFFDQAWLSAANFLVGVFLIKTVSKESYGMYVFAYAVILFGMGVQNALVNMPMTVLFGSKKAEQQRRFCSELTAGQYLVLVPVTAIVLAGLAVAARLDAVPSQVVEVAGVIGIATLGVFLREFFRSLLYLESRAGTVLALDIMHVALMFAGLFICSAVVPESTHLWAIVIFGASSLFSGIVAGFILRLPSPIAHIRTAWSTLRESWKLGKWALGGVIVTWLQDQSYIYLLTMLVNASATASAGAARLLMVPVGLVSAGLAKIVIPRWSQMRYDRQIEQLCSMAKKLRAVMVLVIVAYALTLLTLMEHVRGLLLTADYPNVGRVVVLWSILFVTQAVKSTYSWLLQVFHEFRLLTLANLVTALGVVGLAVVLIRLYGVEGSLMALIAGDLALIVSMAAILRTVVARERGAARSDA